MIFISNIPLTETDIGLFQGKCDVYDSEFLQKYLLKPFDTVSDLNTDSKHLFPVILEKEKDYHEDFAVLRNYYYVTLPTTHQPTDIHYMNLAVELNTVQGFFCGIIIDQ